MSEEKKTIDPQPKAASAGEIGLESLPVTTYWSDVFRQIGRASCRERVYEAV